VKINPTIIYFYYKISELINGEVKELTFLAATGSNFWVDMDYEEFDEYWGEVKRSFEIDEPLY
jgi:hypothetical protein